MKLGWAGWDEVMKSGDKNSQLYHVNSGDMKDVPVRAPKNNPNVAFLVAVILYHPESLGAIAEVIEDTEEGRREGNQMYVSTHWLTTEYQKIEKEESNASA